MHLNHLNLPVPALLATAAYLREFFGMRDLGPKTTTTMGFCATKPE